MAIAAYGFGLDPSASGLGAFVSVVSLRGRGGGSSSHGQLTDLGPPADDHEQYLLLSGRSGQTIVDNITFNGNILFNAVTDQIAGIENQNLLDVSGIAGGETIIGGTGASDELGLRGSTNATLGALRLFSKLVLEPVQSQAVPVDELGSSIEFGGAFSTTAALKQVLLLNDSTWTINAGSDAFGGRLVEDTSTTNINQAGGILAFFSVVNTSSAYVVTDNAVHVPNLFGMRWAPRIEASTGGTPPETTLVAGMQINPAIKCTGLFSNYTITEISGVQFQPTWSVASGTIADFGDCLAVDFRGPTRGFVAPDAGVKRMGDGVGLRMREPQAGLDVQGNWIGLQSQMAFATNRFMFRNEGGAKSTFGLGFTLFGTLDAEQFVQRWDAANAQMIMEALNATSGLKLNARRVVIGTVDALQSNPVFLTINPPVEVATSTADLSTISIGAGLQTNGFAVGSWSMVEYKAPDSFGAGSVLEVSNAIYGGMSQLGTVSNQSQWVREGGRRRLDGIETLGAVSVAQITVRTDNYALPAQIDKRAILIIDSDASQTITGIEAAFPGVQDGDQLEFYNDGANDIVFGHEDAFSSAANRITTPTGQDWTVGPEEWVCMWRNGEAGVDRWVIKDRLPRAAEIVGPILDTQLEDALANTIQLRNAGSTGPRADVKISALTEETAPTTGDWILGEESGGALRKIDAKHLIKPTLTFREVIKSPTASEDRVLWRTPVDITITAVHGVIKGGASVPTVTLSILHHTDVTQTGNQAVNAQAVTSVTTGDSLTLGGDVDIPAGSWIWWITSAQGGTTPEIALTITYTED